MQIYYKTLRGPSRALEFNHSYIVPSLSYVQICGQPFSCSQVCSGLVQALSRPHRFDPPHVLCPWGSPSKNIGVDCHFLLDIYWGLNSGLLHCMNTSPPEPPGSPYTRKYFDDSRLKGPMPCLNHDIPE